MSSLGYCPVFHITPVAMKNILMVDGQYSICMRDQVLQNEAQVDNLSYYKGPQVVQEDVIIFWFHIMTCMEILLYGN